MVSLLNKNTAIVSIRELGFLCWLACRFIPGSRCLRVMSCTYPVKKHCRAVDAEVAYLVTQKRQSDERYYAKVSQLLAEKQGRK